MERTGVEAMDERRERFLNTMIAILGRLQDTSTSKGEPLLASMLAIARKEAEDALRHAGDLDELAERRMAGSATQTWRACDQPPEDEAAAIAEPEAAESPEPTPVAA